MQLKLQTDYDVNGNSSGRQIDTLAIAIEGQDYNTLEESNIDWMWQVEDGARTYWIENDSEHYFQKSLTKEQARVFADDLEGYEAALKEYQKTNFEDVRAGDYDPKSEAQRACADEMEKALSEAQSELYHDWLYGDYRGNFDGVLPLANKRYSEYDIEVSYDEKNDIVSIELSDDTIASLYDNGEIERKTQKAVKEWIELDIDHGARAKYNEAKRKQEARRAENERVREYKRQQAEAKKEAKKNELLQLAK